MTLPDAPATRGVVLRKAAAVYDWLSPPMMLGHEGRINRRAIELLQLRRGDAVLDLGCATGRVALLVARKLSGTPHATGSDPGKAADIRVFGLDASPEMIRLARRKADRAGLPCQFDVGLAERLPYGDASFDKVVSTFFFHHLIRDDKLAALREVNRVLRPDGLFVLVDVDVPTTWLGRACTACAAWLFKQPELEENIRGLLPTLFAVAGFARGERKAHDLGYLTTFLLAK